ncbi:uncharacterized protein LOC119665695 [Teleopsis dalmanni]|uniref:uncharacterized protein LOC119665695 n=1 Tax=Teleopsis dalmanni TaxID=139649 RepID=UPI0018CEDFC2|nr:uncharacterized protein LOC119665695 [Teleopsis dalmanni]
MAHSSGANYSLNVVGIKHQLTAPYTPQENPTERVNRTIKTLMSQIVHNEQRKWDEVLPEIAFAINTAKSDSTVFSPAFLVQGRELRLPATVFNEYTPGIGDCFNSPCNKSNKLEQIFKIVKQNLHKAASTQARYYNQRRRKWKPQLQQLVLVKQHYLSKASNDFSAKLAPKFDGPYRVQKFISRVITELVSINTGKCIKSHMADLRVYYGK